MSIPALGHVPHDTFSSNNMAKGENQKNTGHANQRYSNGSEEICAQLGWEMSPVSICLCMSRDQHQIRSKTYTHTIRSKTYTLMSVFLQSSKTCFQDATNKPVLISLYLSWRKLEITKTCKAKNANPKPPPSDISTKLVR